jgi:uncharacterized linocin/CFP29 family protein
MADDAAQLPWTSQQWADLRAAALDSARSARVASTFLPLVGPLPPDEATVPSNWMRTASLNMRQLGEAENRLEIRSGKTLHLVTISCNVYLRGSEVADSELSAAKTMVHRAAEVLGRLEDAIVFHGVPNVDDDKDKVPTVGGTPLVQPLIYRITGGRDLTGLLQAPDTYFASTHNWDARELEDLKQSLDALTRAKSAAEQATATAALRKASEPFAQDIMCVGVDAGVAKGPGIVEAVVHAIEKLETKGHFGPFAVILGHALFSRATGPSDALVLPTDRLAEFLDGRRVMRSGTLPPDDGLVVALGGQPIELVLARDVDLSFLQVTIEPRYVLRVFERFVLRIKELDSVCRLTMDEGRLLTPPKAGS